MSTSCSSLKCEDRRSLKCPSAPRSRPPARVGPQGHADAQFQLGNMYAFGFAGPKHDADADRLAAQWYFEAARQNHADAQYSLGILFLTGTGVVQDSAEAQKWIERAAAAGHADAAAYVRDRRK